MIKQDLKESLVCYWQLRGWHGCNQIIRFNQRFVYFVTYPIKDEFPQLHRKRISEFLNEHEVILHLCEYNHFHKSIGEVKPIQPTSKRINIL